MRGGSLRHRITFQTRSTAQDAYGDQVDTWADTFINIPAAVEPLSGRELIAAQAVRNESQFTVITRYIPGFDPNSINAMRIVFGARYLNILNVNNIDERNRELQFSCSEGVAKG